MLKDSSEGLTAVLSSMEPEAREALLIELLKGEIDWDETRLDALPAFASERVIAALVQRIKRADQGDREELLEALARMGPRGQAELRGLLKGAKKGLLLDVLDRLEATREAALLAKDLLASPSKSAARGSFKLWDHLGDDDLFDLLTKVDVPPEVAARLLANRHYHPRAAELADALPDIASISP